MSKAKKRVLIVWGGWEGHHPEACAQLMETWLQSEGYTVVLSDSLDILANARRMSRFDLFIPIWTMGKLSENQWNGLRTAVLKGLSVAGFHGGMGDAFRENSDYQFMMGGQFVCHPGNMIRYKVKITKPKDSIVKGLKDFWVNSEQYYMHVDPSNEVLATTTFSGKHDGVDWIRGTVMPVAWKRRYGKGRIFYSALGHEPSEFNNPPMFEMLKRGILWAMREPLK